MNNINPFELFITDPVELSLMTFKSDLMILITSIIRKNNWTQNDAAKALGVTQPRISDLMNGKIAKFSIDMLLEMLLKSGYQLDKSFDKDKLDNPISLSILKR